MTEPITLSAFADALRATFPGCEDAPLASTLLRLLAQGRPVNTESLGAAIGRDAPAVAAQVARWPNIQRDSDGRIEGFSGLTLRPTQHRFTVEARELYTWCAWDTLFLPATLEATAVVRSTCPVTGEAVELELSPDRVLRAQPQDLFVSFPALASTDTADITGSFCCHVHFLAGADAAGTWSATHPDGRVLDLQAAFELGCRTVEPLVGAAGSSAEPCC
jgi:alkylmercury lyase